MRWMRQWGALAVVLAVGAGGCGDDGGPGGDLTDDQRAELASALEANVPFASLVVDNIGSIGKLDPAASAAVRGAVSRGLSMSANGLAATSYDAFGMIIQVTGTTPQGPVDEWMIAVVGWNGLQASSVDELVMVFGAGTGTVPSSASGTFDQSDILGLYFANDLLYIATTGNASMSSASFGSGTTDCSGSYDGFTVTCELAVGQMDGDFDFVAEEFSSSATYTQAPVVFSGLPTVRLILDITG